MIKLRDWVATIPDEDKHIAYVGENSAVQRQFWLSPEMASAFGDSRFYLDMAFDLSSVTKRDRRQVVTTLKNVTENIGETQVTTATNDRKETFTVEEVTVDTPAETDIVTLSKQVSSFGIVLTWTVLAQHTALPGKLIATLRAVRPDGLVKKSALMVFEVDPAVVATPAAPITQNVYQQMMDEMSNLCRQAASHCDSAVDAAELAQEAMGNCADYRRYIEEDVTAASAAANTATNAAKEAIDAAGDAIDAAKEATNAAAQVDIAVQKVDDAYVLAAEAGEVAGQVKQLLENNIGPRIDALESAVEDMDIALDSIIAIQNQLITVITFTIGGVEYQADDGMTWGKWVASEYNTDGYYVDADDDLVYDSDRDNVGLQSGEFVHGNDVIIAGHAYQNNL